MMTLEQLEILTHQHYHVSLSLLNQVKRVAETASSAEARQAAEERHQKMLQLHRLVEERYQQLWQEPCSEKSEGSIPLLFQSNIHPTGTPPMALKNSLELPCHASHLSTARRMTETLLVESETDQEVIDKVLMVVGELCGNVILHADLNPDDCFTVEIEIIRGTAYVTVTDGGKGFVRNRSMLSLWESECGRGLMLVEAVSDEVEYLGKPGGGSTVQAKVALSRM